jgi:enamine deaminase RidA (YjgF/YER057c/UK114 family)
MAELQRAAVTSDHAPQPLGAYSVGMKVNAGQLVYVAGQVGVDTAGNLVGPGDAAAQTRQVLRNIGHILEAAGAGFSNVVEFTTYVVGRSSVAGFIEGRNQAYPDMYPNGDYPPNTLLVVDGLVREEFLVEIKAVAALP